MQTLLKLFASFANLADSLNRLSAAADRFTEQVESQLPGLPHQVESEHNGEPAERRLPAVKRK